MRARRLLLAAAIALAAAPALAQGELRIALQDDPDTLDPATNWSFVGRHVLQALCDKVVDIDTKGTIVPMLATGWTWAEDGKTLTLTIREGATFHDGEPVNAEAVRYNLDRALTMKGSRRRSEIEVIDRIEAPDARTVRIALKQPSVPLLAALADRAGMIVSPKAAEAAGADFTKKPVCSGPYRFVEHRAQDRLVLEKFPGHWRAKDQHFDRLVYRGIPDSNVRLLNLRSGQVDLIDRLAPTDIKGVEADRALAVHEVSGLGYYALTFNMAEGAGANADLVKHKGLRRAIDLAIDREAINQVAFDGRAEAGNQPFPPASPWYDKDRPARPRDLAGAKKALAEAGLKSATIDLLVPTDPQRQQVAQIVQAMLSEAGITLNIVSTELMSLLDRARQGRFQAHLVGWSGRVDPDLNITPLLGCAAAGAGNDGRYCNPKLDEALASARAVPDVEERKRRYKAAIGIILDDLPVAYLYHQKWTFASRAGLKGFSLPPDGIIRLDGVTLGK